VAGKSKAIRIQQGALPYRFRPDGSIEILLVTSRQTRRWIIPKGWPIKGLKPAKSAAREAYEEAGVRGTMAAKSIGSFIYDKWLEDGVTVPCEVRVFPLLVERQHKSWPERDQRETRWLTPAAALALLEDPGLRDVLATFVARLVVRKAAE
jgi:8-oxo-dGTP pyrophosphatase MutT (NUDIX family)